MKRLKRHYYSDSITRFLKSTDVEILGKLAMNNDFSLEQTQRNAWLAEINILQEALSSYRGSIYFEYSIPRMGKRIDTVILIGPVIFVLEFKIGETEFASYAVDQVWDYALDLKNFHESSHDQFIAPILTATKAENVTPCVAATPQNDKLLLPIMCNVELLGQVIAEVLCFAEGVDIDPAKWELGRYCPTPTIIEAAMALYNGHSVSDISRSDASAINLSQTSEAISQIIRCSKGKSHKSICFVTGVPGAGKTLVGLNIANRHSDESNDLYSVFLSGNAPLVMILREALARDKVRHEKERGVKIKKGEARSIIKKFIQNVHHFQGVVPELLEVKNDEEDPGADYTGNDDPDGQIQNHIGGHPQLSRPQTGQHYPDQEGDGQHQSVTVNCEPAHLKNIRMHDSYPFICIAVLRNGYSTRSRLYIYSS